MIPVTTAAQSAARDARAIDAGIPSRALMRAAGFASAAEIARRFPDRLSRGVAVFAGPGNNGGDAWVVAGALAAMGVSVRVSSPLVPRTPDAIAEAEWARPLVAGKERPHGGEELVVDGLLGTGSRGAPRGALSDAVADVVRARVHGARVVSLDLPSGLDAEGEGEGAASHRITADLTLAYGTLKRAHLSRRDRCGLVVLVDIGLGDALHLDDAAPLLVDEGDVRRLVPAIAADAHKGTRGRVLVVGGGPGMAGAAILAGRAALASGAGLVRLCVAPESVASVHAAVPAALADAWPVADADVEPLVRWADAIVAGPGLGRSAQASALLDAILRVRRAPVVLDADALNRFEGATDGLAAALHGEPALLTPHPLEFARLAGTEVAEVLASRFDAPARLAQRLGAAVLLKGVPTVVGAPGEAARVIARGTPVLATGGSGDVLAGIAGVLLAQGLPPAVAGACAAWIHGRAAELAGAGFVRGVGLEEVLASLPGAWRLPEAPRPPYPVLVELPALPVG